MTLPGPQLLARNLAIFLDVDGTLLEIASTPDAVKVPAGLGNVLQLVSRSESGALALVSGRPIGELDAFFSPHKFPAAGQHGLERRDAKGILHPPQLDAGLLDGARRVLHKLELAHEGLLLEDKRFALAMHYRLAPETESSVTMTMKGLLEHLQNRFLLRSGKCVLELAPRGVSKRTAIEAFMQEPPFRGRVPVFVGDDVTDEDGFAAVNELDGYSIRVGPAVSSVAKYRFDNVSEVIGWLHERCRHSQSKGGP